MTTSSPSTTRSAVPLSALKPPADNPRTVFDETALEGLAASILQDGLLQNLVVTPVRTRAKTPRYRIISGERRFRALSLLAGRGDIPQDHPVPVEIRDGLSADDALRVATVENVQREQLAPMDEAHAFARLVRDGESLEDVAAKAGCSALTVKRRLALASLASEVQDAVREGQITLSQAEALTLGTHDQQRELLEDCKGDQWFDAESVRDWLLDERVPVARAIFPLEQYTGTLTGDLFGEADTTYFDDAEQFLALQTKAADALAARHEQTAAWVERTNVRSVPFWQYDEAEAGEAGGVIVNLTPTGLVEVHKNLVRREIDPDTARETADTPAAPATKATYPRPLCRIMAYQKSLAVQSVLLTNLRTAKEIAAVKLLHTVGLHDALPHYEGEAERPAAYSAIEAIAALFLDVQPDPGDDSAAWFALLTETSSEVARYERVKALGDEALDLLCTLLTAIRFGQDACETLDADDTLFNRVAQDLGVEMREHWTPDRDFLSRRTMAQLGEIADQIGYRPNVIKKGQMVDALARFFANATTAKRPTDVQLRARTWLPDAMRFPAIDPDAESAPE